MVSKISEFTNLPVGTRQRIDDLGIVDAEQLLAIMEIPSLALNLQQSLQLTPLELADLQRQLQAAVPPMAFSLANEGPMTLGVLPPLQDSKSKKMPMTAAPFAVLPPSTSLIPTFGVIRSQEHRGTCVAFTVSALREQLAQTQGMPFDASEQFLYHRTKMLDGQPATCGTWQEIAVQVLQADGVCSEAVWNYDGNPPCNNNGVEPAAAVANAAKYVANHVVLNSGDVSGAKAILANGLAVGLSVPVYDSWYRNAVVKQTGSIGMPLLNEIPTGGHAMCIAGYIDGPDPGGGRFILRNSWGAAWASQSIFGPGYGSIPYAYVANFGWELVSLQQSGTVRAG